MSLYVIKNSKGKYLNSMQGWVTRDIGGLWTDVRIASVLAKENGGRSRHFTVDVMGIRHFRGDHFPV